MEKLQVDDKYDVIVRMHLETKEEEEHIIVIGRLRLIEGRFKGCKVDNYTCQFVGESEENGICSPKIIHMGTLEECIGAATCKIMPNKYNSENNRIYVKIENVDEPEIFVRDEYEYETDDFKLYNCDMSSSKWIDFIKMTIELRTKWDSKIIRKSI